MEKIISEGKTFEEALGKTGLDKEMVIYKQVDAKNKLFKNKAVSLEIYKKDEVIEEVKRFLKAIIENLNVEVSFETSTKDERITINVFTNDNAIIIGKDGNTIKSLEVLAKQYVYIKTGISFIFSIDVGNYKKKRESNLVYLAKKLASEVKKTSAKVEMDSMNSYERRIVHNTLNEIEGIKTESKGEEPNRYIVIYPNK